MSDKITVSILITTEQKDNLELWATEEDRSVSAVIRRILDGEEIRRTIRREVKDNSN